MGDDRAVRWLDGIDARPLADDHHAFHEDAKPGGSVGSIGHRALQFLEEIRGCRIGGGWVPILLGPTVARVFFIDSTPH